MQPLRYGRGFFSALPDPAVSSDYTSGPGGLSGRGLKVCAVLADHSSSASTAG